MKCPDCGLWNRASQPHCTRCGAPLNIDEASHHGWKETLKDGGASTTYLRADEFGLTDQTPEPRDQLAREMQDLKQRKQRGAQLQQRLREDAPASDSGRVVVTEKMPPEKTTLFPKPSSSKRFQNPQHAQGANPKFVPAFVFSMKTAPLSTQDPTIP